MSDRFDDLVHAALRRHAPASTVLLSKIVGRPATPADVGQALERLRAAGLAYPLEHGRDQWAAGPR